MIRVERMTSASPGQIWAHLGNLERWAQMLPTIDEITSLDASPTMMGSRFRVRQPGLPTAEYVVTDWRPDTGFTWQTRGGGVTVTATHDVEVRDGDTMLRLGLGWSGPMARLHHALFARKARAFIAKEADAFVALAEAPGNPNTRIDGTSTT